MRAGGAVASAGDEIDGGAVLVAALDAGIGGVAALGKSQAGEKTMLDALIPALEAGRAAAAGGADTAAVAAAMATAAEDGVQATIPMLATKGRASYLGERSIGHQDPGATSSALLLRALADAATRG
jgi:dihydroxyacetone kinase-like protein